MQATREEEENCWREEKKKKKKENKIGVLAGAVFWEDHVKTNERTTSKQAKAIESGEGEMIELQHSQCIIIICYLFYLFSSSLVACWEKETKRFN